MYRFYYDESEHSRKINYDTISASNYYDNFVSVIVGWPEEKEQDIFKKYLSFESTYSARKNKKGELKSDTLKQKQFNFGFASMTRPNFQFLEDFFSLWDEEMHFYFFIASKIEYLILQLFAPYKNNPFINISAMVYTITKALVSYRPEKVLKCIYYSPESFVYVLKDFFRERIEFNKKNIQLKKEENQAFEGVLICLQNISVIPILDWNYYMPFIGFHKYLSEEKITDYCLTIDKEGENSQESQTLQAAHSIGLHNTIEADSLSTCGIRIADMLAGIITKLLKALCDALRYHSLEEGTTKKLLDPRWFQINEKQYALYKKLYEIVCEWDPAWYKSYAGIYSDDLTTFIALLGYMNRFESVKQIYASKLNMQSEYFNGYVYELLHQRFEEMK